MKVLGIGMGSIGQRHFNNLLNDYKDVKLSAYREIGRELKFIDKNKIEQYHSLDMAFKDKPDIVFITNPTSIHIPYSIEAAKNRCDIFIEKPLSHNMKGIDELLRIVDKNKLITLMGCNMRFYPCIKIIKQLIYDNRIGDIISVKAEFGTYVPDWHPWEDYRESYAARKDLGGGAVLTNIHEIDYLYWLFGDVDKLFAYTGKDSSLEMDTEDNAEIILKFKNGIVGNIHLDMFSRPYRRGCTIMGENGTISWDFSANNVVLYDNEEKKWNITFEGKPTDTGQTYVDELKHFMDCVDNRTKTINDVHEGKRVLEIALAAKKSSSQRKWIKV